MDLAEKIAREGLAALSEIDHLRAENHNLRARNKQLLSALSRAYAGARSRGERLIDALDLDTWDHDAGSRGDVVDSRTISKAKGK